VKGGKDTGKVLAYDARGRLVWEHQTAERYPYDTAASNRMAVNDLFVADLWQTGEPHIVVVSNDYTWYPSKLSILDRTGAVKRLYWHPGHIQRAMAFKPSSGPRLRILAWGCNNGMARLRPGSAPGHWYRGMVCLDPETMEGEAPPRLGSLQKGREAWYVLFLPQDAVIHDVRLRSPVAGVGEGSPGQLIEVTGPEATREFLYLNENGEWVGSASGTGSTQLRTELIAQDQSLLVPGTPPPQTQTAPATKPN
jgi:hypothetical protein